jgi:hypothetical protein
MATEARDMLTQRTANQPPRATLRAIIAYCTERDTLLRSIKTALVVGTILGLINHGQDMLTGQFSLRWIVPMLITYLVPFSVATYGQVQGKRQRDRMRVEDILQKEM